MFRTRGAGGTGPWNPFPTSPGLRHVFRRSLMRPRGLLLVASLLIAMGQASIAAERHVVVISIDGLPSYYFNDPHASLPVIRGLAKSGVAAVEGMHVSN